MGTLFEQSVRRSYGVGKEEIEHRLEIYKAIIKKHDITMSELIEINKVLEMERANDLAVRDGDSKDEQLAGFGELMQELIAAIRGPFGGD